MHCVAMPMWHLLHIEGAKYADYLRTQIGEPLIYVRNEWITVPKAELDMKGGRVQILLEKSQIIRLIDSLELVSGCPSLIL
jgi:hypothetical protein